MACQKMCIENLRRIEAGEGSGAMAWRLTDGETNDYIDANNTIEEISR